MESEKPAFREMLSQRLFQKPFNELNRDQQYELFNGAGLTGNNLLIKDPSIMRYKLTGETPNYAEGGAVEVSTYDPARVDDIVNQIREGIYG